MAKRPNEVPMPNTKAQIIENDPRDVRVESSEEKKEKTTDDQLVAWVLQRVDQWRAHRDSYMMSKWDRYERLWRMIYSKNDSNRESEKARLVGPALSEAVENSVSEIEEALFGRGRDFFEAQGEFTDNAILKRIVDINKARLKEDLAKNNFVVQVAEVLLNGAVYGTGIGEIVLVDKIERDIMPRPDMETMSITAEVIEKTVTYAMLRSINPRNFIPDPNHNTIDGMMGCAIEENAPAHEIYAGMENGDYRTVKLDSTQQDSTLMPDQQEGSVPFSMDVIPLIKYYGLVPQHLLMPEDKVEELFPSEKGATGSDDPAHTKMVEAVIVIANKSALLKAESNPHLMRDRNVIAFRWDKIPGSFWGRGVCEKGTTPQLYLDAELRHRIDSLAFSAAPLMGIDGTKLPRGFKFTVYPGRSVITSGDPSTILKPFKFGQLDQNTFQQAEMLDKMVQRATGAPDGISMAQSGVGGDARSGAVSMSLSGIVKRSKRTLMGFIDEFMQPAIRKLMWRNMQYNTDRYVPVNFSFDVTSTMGIMQREYEMQTLTQLIGMFQDGTPEKLMVMQGVIANTGLQNRTEIMKSLEESAKQAQQMQAMQAQLAAQQGGAQGQAPTETPADQMLKQARAQESMARAGLIGAQTQTEQLEPMLRVRELATKGIYASDNAEQAFKQRMAMADRILKARDIKSNEDIARGQMQGSLLKERMASQAKVEAARIKAQGDVAATAVDQPALMQEATNAAIVGPGR